MAVLAGAAGREVRSTKDKGPRTTRGKASVLGPSYLVLRTFRWGASAPLLFHDVVGLLDGHLFDLAFVGLEQVLHLLLALVAFVLGHLLVLLRGVEVLVGVAANVAARHLGILGRLLDP